MNRLLKLWGGVSMYTFTRTEQNTPKANEQETKAMLFLFGFHSDRKEIDLAFIDCFNDVTGTCKNRKKLWDVQSKNVKTIGPSHIGDFLVSLLENYVEKISFTSLILFTRKIDRRYLKNPTLKIYGLNNLVDDTYNRVKMRLQRKYESIKPSQIDSFLNEVVIIQDNRRVESYVKGLVQFNSYKIVKNELYTSIFKEIRDMQSAKKNIPIHNIKVDKVLDVLEFKKHIDRKDIEKLIINRIIGADLFSSSILNREFSQFLDHKYGNNLSVIHVSDILEDCNSNLCRAFFDSSNSKKFWKLLEFVIKELPLSNSVTSTLGSTKDHFKFNREYFTDDTVAYLISIIKKDFQIED